jgi:uncharacterized protein (TIGR02147 family)
MRRSGKNPRYSLRAFARSLGVNHATLSSILSGKRTITTDTFEKFAKTLGLEPKQVDAFKVLEKADGDDTPRSYYLLQQDAFNAISEWYYDAILELSLIPNFKLEPSVIAASIGITALQAKIALETLERLELLVREKSGRLKIQHQNSTNILDPDFTTAAQKKYQRSVLEKSQDALENIDRKLRDHTSTTMAIESKDLPEVKKLIQKFRHDLNAYLQRPKSKPDSIYQLQVSFFPLTANSNQKSEKSL